jgi:hypothetical protein
MSKHTNKHWLREKEFRSLKNERDSTPRYPKWSRPQSSRLCEINERLSQKFYNEYHGWFHTAPWWYRNMLNRRQRAKSKIILYKLINISDDFVFDDNYKDGPWYW